MKRILSAAAFCAVLIFSPALSGPGYAESGAGCTDDLLACMREGVNKIGAAIRNLSEKAEVDKTADEVEKSVKKAIKDVDKRLVHPDQEKDNARE